MVRRRIWVVLVGMVVAVVLAPPVTADPEVVEPPADPPPAEVITSSDTAAPVDDGRLPSSPPATTRTPDGWTLTVSSKDETMMPVAPLTTALSSRDYIAGGIFDGKLVGPDGDPARGVLEVGYQIGCGIDMSTSNGVTLTGTAGITAGVGITSVGPVPTVLAPVTGGIAVGLKPGIVNIIPVDKKEFKGSAPWVMISNFHVKIDGCVGQSFIRSYATLTRQTEQSDAVLSYIGVTKIV